MLIQPPNNPPSDIEIQNIDLRTSQTAGTVIANISWTDAEGGPYAVTENTAEFEIANINNTARTADLVLSASAESICSPVTNVTVTVEDSELQAGSSNPTTITPVDDVDPMITCPGDQTASGAPNACTVSLPDYRSLVSSSDNCGSVTVTQSPAPGSNVPEGDTQVTFTATDVAGNTADCSITFTAVINDTEAPVLICPPNPFVNNVPGTCEGIVPNLTVLASVNDNCDSSPSVVQTPLAGTQAPGGTQITIIATDAAGNSQTCTVTLAIVDTEVPAISCPGDQTLDTSPGVCNRALPDYRGAVTVSDNCPASLAVVQNPPVGTMIPAGSTQMVTMSAEDESGNVGTCTFMVTVEDNEAPVVTPSAGATEAIALGSGPFSIPPADATDNCDGVLVPAANCIAGDCTFDTNLEGNTWTIEYSATDTAGNPGSATTVFTVSNDTTPPVISGPAGTIIIDCGDTLSPADALAGYSVTDDTDSSPSLTVNLSGLGSPRPPGTYTIRYEASDASGNEASQTRTVAVTNNCPLTATILSPDEIDAEEETTVMLSVDVTGAVGTPSIEWVFDGPSGPPQVVATGPSFTFTARVSRIGEYFARVTDDLTTVESNTVFVTLEGFGVPLAGMAGLLATGAVVAGLALRRLRRKS